NWQKQLESRAQYQPPTAQLARTVRRIQGKWKDADRLLSLRNHGQPTCTMGQPVWQLFAHRLRLSQRLPGTSRSRTLAASCRDVMRTIVILARRNKRAPEAPGTAPSHPGPRGGCFFRLCCMWSAAGVGMIGFVLLLAGISSGCGATGND